MPLIESLVNLESLRQSRVFVFAVPVPAYGTDAMPLRVLAFEGARRTDSAAHAWEASVYPRCRELEVIDQRERDIRYAVHPTSLQAG